MEYKTVVRKLNVSITKDEIVKIIRKLNSDKGHKCDNMSICMLGYWTIPWFVEESDYCVSA